MMNRVIKIFFLCSGLICSSLFVDGRILLGSVMKKGDEDPFPAENDRQAPFVEGNVELHGDTKDSSIVPSEITQPLRSDETIQFQNQAGDIVNFAVEVPNSFSKFMQGLMFRNSLQDPQGEARGMIFSWDKDGDARGFWMKNTFIDLDIMWVNEKGTVVSVKRAKKESLEGVNTDAVARWVIEARAGWADANGIVAGQSRVLTDLAKDIAGKRGFVAQDGALAFGASEAEVQQARDDKVMDS